MAIVVVYQDGSGGEPNGDHHGDSLFALDLAQRRFLS